MTHDHILVWSCCYTRGIACRYFDAAMLIFQEQRNRQAQSAGKQSARQHQQRQQQPVIFLGTEDPSVLEEARGRVPRLVTGDGSRVRLVYTDLFDRETQLASVGHMGAGQQQSSGGLGHHDLEYLSMLLNLHISLRCHAW